MVTCVYGVRVHACVRSNANDMLRCTRASVLTCQWKVILMLSGIFAQTGSIIYTPERVFLINNRRQGDRRRGICLRAFVYVQMLNTIYWIIMSRTTYYTSTSRIMCFSFNNFFAATRLR